MAMNLIQQLGPQWQFKMYISHLVALSNNSVIGVNNDLPWTLKRDLKHLLKPVRKALLELCSMQSTKPI